MNKDRARAETRQSGKIHLLNLLALSAVFLVGAIVIISMALSVSDSSNIAPFISDISEEIGNLARPPEPIATITFEQEGFSLHSEQPYQDQGFSISDEETGFTDQGVDIVEQEVHVMTSTNVEDEFYAAFSDELGLEKYPNIEGAFDEFGDDLAYLRAEFDKQIPRVSASSFYRGLADDSDNPNTEAMLNTRNKTGVVKYREDLDSQTKLRLTRSAFALKVISELKSAEEDGILTKVPPAKLDRLLGWAETLVTQAAKKGTPATVGDYRSWLREWNTAIEPVIASMYWIER